MAYNYRNTLAAWAFALAASISFGADKRTIVNEGFENGADCAAFSDGLFQKQFLKPVSGAEALSGGGSVLAEARGRANILVVKDLKPGAVYLFRLTYKIADFGKNGRTAFKVSASAGGKTPPFSAPNLSAPVLGRKLAMKEGYRIPDDGKEYSLAITLNPGARVYFDDVRIDEIVPEARNGYLFCQPHDHRDIFADREFPGMYYSPTAYSFLDPDSPILDMPREKFFPFIDKWGQYKYSDWPNKIKSDEQLKAMEKLEREYYLKNPKPAARDKYGALENSRGDFKPTGRFCVDKVGGKWMLRAPNGNLFWAFALNSVGLSNSATAIEGREHFFDDISDEFGCITRTTQYPILHYPPDAKLKVANLKLRTYMWKYGLKTYAEALAKSKEICDWRMSNWGVPAYGAWAAPNLLENPAHPYIVICNSPKRLCARNCHLKVDPSVRKLFRMVPDVCDPRFRKYVARDLANQKEKIRNEYCIGVYIDNEVPWERKEGYTAEAILTCPEKQKAKIAFRDFLKRRHGEIEKLNAAWGASYADWGAFLKERKFIPSTKAGQKDVHDFDKIFHARYYAICREELKKIDPDVLYCGSRLAWRNRYAVEGAAKYCDIVSFNLYWNDVENFREMKYVGDKPVMVGEFSFSRSDYGHFWKGLRQAADGETQIALFEHFMESVLRHPNFVGAGWFTYGDQDTSGRPDGENAAFGIVDVCDTPHFDLVDAFRKMSGKMFDIRLGENR